MSQATEGRVITCLTCRHWEGDKAKTHRMIQEHGEIVMDRKDGWAVDGQCAIQYEWLTITIHGDASAYAEVPANFGCQWGEAE